MLTTFESLVFEITQFYGLSLKVLSCSSVLQSSVIRFQFNINDHCYTVMQNYLLNIFKQNSNLSVSMAFPKSQFVYRSQFTLKYKKKMYLTMEHDKKSAFHTKHSCHYGNKSCCYYGNIS